MKTNPLSARSWRGSLVRISTLLGGGFVLFSILLTPIGVTVSWSFFLATYGVTLLLGLLGIAGFVLCLLRGERVRAVYAILDFLYITAFFVASIAPVYRLRWQLIFP